MRRIVLLLTVFVLATGGTWRRGDGYILHTGATNVTMSNRAIREMMAIQRRLGDSDYLWARIEGHEYLIRDEALLRDADSLWAPLRAMRPEERALSREESELDHRIDAIEDHRTEEAEPGELRRLRDRYRIVDRRLREIERRNDEMEKVVEAKLRDLIDDAIRDGRARELP